MKWTVIVLVMSLGLAGSTQAQAPDPIGEEFQVNSYTTSWQVYPAVAVEPQGDFVVVWMSDGSYGTDTSGYSIQAQRYGANGAPVGGEFQVNAYTTNFQGTPAVAVEPQGDFVVVWESDGSYGTDTSSSSIQGQLYGANGATRGGRVPGQRLHDGWPSGTCSGCRSPRQFRGGLDERRLVRHGHERLEHPGPALRLGRRTRGGPVPGQHLHDELPKETRGGGGRPRRLRGGLAKQRLARHGYERLEHPGPAL
ncbi:MAG: hypothetical protein WBO69_20085 [Thermoanaerobaculia bacterium]